MRTRAWPNGPDLGSIAHVDIEREGRVKARPIGSCRGSYSRLAVTPRSRRNRPRRGGRALGRAQAVVGRPDGPAATRACAEPRVRTHKHEVQRLSSARPARPSPPRPPARGRCQTPRERATWRPCGPMARVGPYDLRRRRPSGSSSRGYVRCDPDIERHAVPTWMASRPSPLAVEGG